MPADVPGAKLLTLVLDNGDVTWAYEAPRGWTGATLQGRESHFAVCPHADEHRRSA